MPGPIKVDNFICACGKVGYQTELLANQALVSCMKNGRDEKMVYACEKRDCWHLSSKGNSYKIIGKPVVYGKGFQMTISIMSDGKVNIIMYYTMADGKTGMSSARVSLLQAMAIQDNLNDAISILVANKEK